MTFETKISFFFNIFNLKKYNEGFKLKVSTKKYKKLFNLLLKIEAFLLKNKDISIRSFKYISYNINLVRFHLTTYRSILRKKKLWHEIFLMTEYYLNSIIYHV